MQLFGSKASGHALDDHYKKTISQISHRCAEPNLQMSILDGGVESTPGKKFYNPS